MRFTLSDDDLQEINHELHLSNLNLLQGYPGDRTDRQAVHTVYGGAHLFKSTSAAKLGSIALRNLMGYAPDFCRFATLLGLPGSETLPNEPAKIVALTERITAASNHPDEFEHLVNSDSSAWLAFTVYQRVIKKLEEEPIEDNRIDFEDGYGNRPNEEEDQHASQAALEVADGMKRMTLPPFIGIRIKPLTEESRQRSVRTLDIFLTQLSDKTEGKLPQNFVITLPKVTHPEQVTALVEILALMEERCKISTPINIELMIETPQSIIDPTGRIAIQPLIEASRGRCRSVHFGTYDYTANLNITAAHQTHTHPACDLARSIMQVALAGTGISISDGATTIMPIAPHRPTPEKPLTNAQIIENQNVVCEAWRLHYNNILHSLKNGIYQGWDLNPAQLPIRYAAVYGFFLTGLSEASHRLQQFLNKAAQATLSGNTFDDAATGQGLLNFFLRGIACGALTEDEALATGITLDELHSRSFVKIVANRAG